MKNIEKFKNTNQDKTGEIGSMYSQLQSITKKLNAPQSQACLMPRLIQLPAFYVPVVAEPILNYNSLIQNLKNPKQIGVKN